MICNPVDTDSKLRPSSPPWKRADRERDVDYNNNSNYNSYSNKSVEVVKKKKRRLRLKRLKKSRPEKREKKEGVQEEGVGEGKKKQK